MNYLPARNTHSFVKFLCYDLNEKFCKDIDIFITPKLKYQNSVQPPSVYKRAVSLYPAQKWCSRWNQQACPNTGRSRRRRGTGLSNVPPRRAVRRPSSDRSTRSEADGTSIACNSGCLVIRRCNALPALKRLCLNPSNDNTGSCVTVAFELKMSLHPERFNR